MLLEFRYGCIVSLLLVAGLCACTKISENPPKVNNSLTLPYPMPASTSLALANQKEGREKQILLLKAAGRMVYDGQWRQGQIILSQISPLTPEQGNEKKLLQAKIDLMREQPQAAISKLAAIDKNQPLTSFQKVQYHEMLAKSYQSLGKTSEGVSERIKLAHLISDEPGQASNRQALWLSLSKLPSAELTTMAVEAPENSELQAWLRLAVIPQSFGNNTQAMIHALQEWAEQNPNHPGNQIIPASLSQAMQKMYNKPHKMALLLPLSDALAGPGNAIKEGFLAGARNAANTSVKIYDTSKHSVAEVYQQAIDEGADYVVGPLSKSEVAVVAALNHPVPTVLLNDFSGQLSTNAWQFGLSPTSEAQQVAAKARQNGNSRALIIAPADSWGNEILAAFRSEWYKEGGKIVDILRYTATDNLNKTLSDFLQITESQHRENELKKLLGKDLHTIPARRMDFDMIFLSAYPSKARQIMPLLKYHYAGNVPVYATSSVYSGSVNAMKDRDLDGIIFCDMPWVFKHQAGYRNWPESFNSYNRLYALGMDSYLLGAQLNQLMVFPSVSTTDHSGSLYLKSQTQIGRTLEWAQFKQGLAQPLEKIS